MSTKYIVQHRRGTTSEWAAQPNIVPYAGEIVIEYCEGANAGKYRIKIGDGVTKFSNLRALSIDDFVQPDTISISIPASGWVGSTSPYSQVVQINGITPNSKIDLQPSPAQLLAFHEKDVAFVTENNNGVVTVYAIGVKPQNNYTIQATITEVTS